MYKRRREAGPDLHAPTSPDVEDDPLTRDVIACAMVVHRTLGPGLLESVYEECLCLELARAGLRFETQVQQQIIYKGTPTGGVLRPDVIVEGVLCIEIKAVEHLLAVHRAQLHTYLKVMNLQVGLLLNFNTYYLRDGIKRVSLRSGT